LTDYEKFIPGGNGVDLAPDDPDGSIYFEWEPEPRVLTVSGKWYPIVDWLDNDGDSCDQEFAVAVVYGPVVGELHVVTVLPDGWQDRQRVVQLDG
jgi:hypothetical protein